MASVLTALEDCCSPLAPEIPENACALVACTIMAAVSLLLIPCEQQHLPKPVKMADNIM